MSPSTNGPRKLSGSREPVMNATKPDSPPASLIDSEAAVRAVSVAAPSKPEPGATRLPTISPSARAMTVMTRK